MKKLIALLVLVVSIGGCATTSTLPRGWIWYKDTPISKYEKDPDVDFSKYVKFAVLPQVELNKNSEKSPIVEKQLLYMLRDKIYGIGYTYVSNPKEADFIVTVEYSNEYKTQYIPPSSYTIPWYVPGQTQTTFLNSYNSFSGTVGSSYFSGMNSGSGTATTTTSGYAIPITQTTPGRYEGWYYPSIVVSVFDSSSKKLVWTGSIVCTTSNADIRLSAQALFNSLFSANTFPRNEDALKNLEKIFENKYGADGSNFVIFTEDGNNFFPCISGVFVNSPAYNSGIRPKDYIIKADNRSLLNLPSDQIMEVTNKRKGESIVLTIKREDKIFDVTLVFEDFKKLKEWKEFLTLGENGKEIRKRR